MSDLTFLDNGCGTNTCIISTVDLRPMDTCMFMLFLLF